MSGEAPKPPAAGGASPGGAPHGGAAGDPAMDDILASIRRILNEDEAPPSGTPAPAPSAPPAEEPLELTEAMMVQPGREEPPPAVPPAVVLPASSPAVEDAPLPTQDSLVAPMVAAATTAAVGKLLRAVAQERTATVTRGGPSIEDVVREELRPLLKEWLDTHLPPLVERLVRAEIERVVGRGLP
jgi:cell pole-organizing protein PopZ